jgi:alpha-mannosidase
MPIVGLDFHLLIPKLSNARSTTRVICDEMYFEYHRGVMTTQASHKRNMRESEEWTVNGEKYASFAWLNGDASPNGQFTDTWKKITFMVPAGATSATETNLMEMSVGTSLPVSGDKMTIPIHPYEILSLRVDYPHTEAMGR